MSAGARFAYVQSRLQARHGRRLTESDWRLLESTEDLTGYLQAARQSFFREWIHHLAAGADAHQIERSLRQDWAAYCDEVARWLPPAWQASAAWLGTIAYLPAVAHLARDGPAWRWMQADPALAALAVHDAAARKQALAGSRYGALARAVAAGEGPLDAWLAQWQATLSRLPGDAQGPARELGAILRRHFRTDFERAGETPAGRRRELLRTLGGRFRRWSGGIGAVFAHLGLIALDAERLRAGLVLRALIPRSEGRPLWA